jgi:hypothetical protein
VFWVRGLEQAPSPSGSIGITVTFTAGTGMIVGQGFRLPL